MQAAISIANRIIALRQREALVSARLDAVDKAARAMGRRRIKGDGDGDGIPYESRNRRQASMVPPPPKFITSDAKVKAENDMHAGKLHELASKGDLAGLKAYSAFSSKSGKLVAYKAALVASLEPKAKPPAAAAPQPAPKAPETPKATAGAWKPAATLQEAQAQLATKGVSFIKVGDTSQLFQYKGKKMSDEVFLTVLNRAGPEIFRLEAKYPGMVDGLKLGQSYPKSGANGTYHPTFRAINLQPPDKVSEGSSYKNKFGAPWSISSSPGGGGFEGVVRHEIGHYVDYATNKKFRDELKTVNLEIGGKKVDTPTWAQVKISEYAKTNTSESLAEMYSLYVHPNYKKGALPPEIEGIMEKLARRGK